MTPVKAFHNSPIIVMDYDLAVIGAGWAGFNAAIRARDLGLKVALVEKGDIGGTCLNRGCIPTKTLIHSARIQNLVKKSATFGIDITNSTLNLAQMRKRQEKVIAQLATGMKFALKGVDFLSGQAVFISANELEIAQIRISAQAVIIACGSRPAGLPGFEFDGEKIISSDDLLNLKNLPESLLVIGGGVIGCEFACFLASLGVRVSIVELMPQLLPGLDKEIARKIENIFKKRGIQVRTGCDVRTLNLSDYRQALLCVGRVADTENFGLEKIGVKTEKGRIVVDDLLRTSVGGIYAAGDCASNIMLAHFAAYQGKIAAQNIARPDAMKKSDASCVPSCIFTDPEIASVGLSEIEALEKQISPRIDRFDFMGSGYARILDETDGFIKIISCAKTGRVLGGAIVGPRAAELIGILTLAVSSRISISQIRETIFAHPTLSESIGEALKD